MQNEPDKMPNDNWLYDLPVQSESIAFKPDEMVACGKCGKSNPPKRLNCLYCVAVLQLPAEHKHLAKLRTRRLETWEKGFNIIYLHSTGAPSDSDLVNAALFLSIDTKAFQQILDLKRPVLISRLESGEIAQIAAQHLEQYKLDTSIVSDEVLQADNLPVRLRGLEFDEDSIVVTSFNTGEQIAVGRREISLIVTGAVFESKIESVEKRKRKESKLLHETHTSSDDFVIDIYRSTDPTGWRIPSKGFDFSCLGAEKGLLARENAGKLAKLRKFARDARFVEDYLAVREVLDTVWEFERKKDFQGLQRSGFGRKDFTTVASSNNLMQFTKYSRLQRQLL